MLEGGRSRAHDLSAGVNPRIEVPDAPKHLGKSGAKEWKRITPILEELGLISGLDRAALSLYCQAYGRLDELETAFNAHLKQRTDAGMPYADAVFDISHSVTPSGYAQQSVLTQLIKSNREQVNRYLMHFGLSPSARGRVQPSNFVQPTLPGVEEKPQAPNGFKLFATGA